MEYSNHQATTTGDNHGWQKVTYAKRRNSHQNKSKPFATAIVDASDDKNTNVFRAIEQQSHDRHQRIVEARKSAIDSDIIHNARSKRDDFDDSDDDFDQDKENGITVQMNDEKNEKKKKKRVERKPKVTVSEAALKINNKPKIPMSHILEAVYKTSVDWINELSVPALNSFVLLLLDNILTDLSSQLSGGKNAKKTTQQPSLKSQVAIFVVMAMVLSIALGTGFAIFCASSVWTFVQCLMN